MDNIKIKTVNPATEEQIEEYDVMSKEKALSVCKESDKVFQMWKQLDISERINHFKNLAAILRKNKEKYARTMTMEMGKPITESLSEVEKCAVLADTLVQHAKTWLSDEEVVADGKKLKNIIDLADALETMSEEIFRHHANEFKNDFGAWVKDVFYDHSLAEDISRSKNRLETQIAVLRRLVKELM